MKRLNLALLVILAFALVLAPASTPTASAQSVPMVAYTVQPGDTLAKIAARYCTTWEEIYQINAAVIGPDPNVLKPGTVLYVPNRWRPRPAIVRSTITVRACTPTGRSRAMSTPSRPATPGIPSACALACRGRPSPRRTAAAGCIPAASSLSRGCAAAPRLPRRSPTSASRTRRPARTCPPPSRSAARARG